MIPDAWQLKHRKWTHTHRLFLWKQLFIVLSVTPELVCKLHLAVYGLSQVLGQDVLTSLTGAQQWQQMRYKHGDTSSYRLFHCVKIMSRRCPHKSANNTESLSHCSHRIQFFHLHQLAAQTPDFLLQQSLSVRATPEWASLLELILSLCLLQLRLQLIHLPPHKNNNVGGQLWSFPDSK